MSIQEIKGNDRDAEDHCHIEIINGVRERVAISDEEQGDQPNRYTPKDRSERWIVQVRSYELNDGNSRATDQKGHQQVLDQVVGLHFI